MTLILPSIHGNINTFSLSFQFCHILLVVSLGKLYTEVFGYNLGSTTSNCCSWPENETQQVYTKFCLYANIKYMVHRTNFPNIK